VRLELTITSTPITNAKLNVARARTRRVTRRFYVSDASTRMACECRGARFQVQRSQFVFSVRVRGSRFRVRSSAEGR
jgi:hypothetical protein